MISNFRMAVALGAMLFCVGAKAGAMKDLHLMVHQSLSMKLFQVEDAFEFMTVRSMNFTPRPRTGADFSVQSEVILRPTQPNSQNEELLCWTDFLEVEPIDVAPSSRSVQIEVLRTDCRPL